MGLISQAARIAVSLGLPARVLDRGAAHNGTRFLACAALPVEVVGNVLVKLNSAGYRVGLYAEHVWGVRLIRSLVQVALRS